MRIQHNIAALNSHRNLTNNNSAVAKNLEKLSSGYRINRAGDDAAGLAISEKMRAQITGLETAQKNAQDGISLVQTAEGALTEVHSMLNRMVELADQSANGTYSDEIDRENLQKEITSLKDEINRIAKATNFNGINLLDGTREADVATPEEVTLDGFPDPAAVNKEGVPGTNTIKHEAGKEEVAPKFSLDLSNLSFEVLTKNGADNKVTITIGGKDVVLDYTTKDVGTIDAAQLATDLAAAVNKLTDSGVTDATTTKAIKGVKVGDLVYTAQAKGNTVEFTLSTEDADNTAITQKVKGTDITPDALIKTSTGAVAANGELKGTINAGSLTITQGVVKQDAIYANTEFTLNASDLIDGAQLKIGDKTYTFRVGADSKVEAGDGVIDLSKYDGTEADFLEKAVTELTLVAADNDMFTVGSQDAGAGKVDLSEKKTYTGKADLTTMEGIKAQVSLTKPTELGEDAKKGLTLQIGDTSDDFNKLTVSIKATDTKALGIDDINISTQDGASKAVDKIKDAINAVSSTRGDLGAIQNRLEHTINNLSVTTENMTAAESRIRDVDMAKEMMAYTKNNILVQASQAMLAQANQLPQGVLQLLQ